MLAVWRDYRTDIGRTYPFLPLSVRQLNQVSTQVDPIQLLSVGDAANIIELKNGCKVPQLVPRQLKIYSSDDAIFAVDYYRPFTTALYEHLSGQLQVRGFEFIGEKIQYSRLTRMIERG